MDLSRVRLGGKEVDQRILRERPGDRVSLRKIAPEVRVPAEHYFKWLTFRRAPEEPRKVKRAKKKK